MHAALPGHALDRTEAELVLPSDLFEELHRGFPPPHLAAPHGTPRTGSVRCGRSGWAIPDHRTGPDQSIKNSNARHGVGYTGIGSMERAKSRAGPSGVSQVSTRTTC